MYYSNSQHSLLLLSVFFAFGGNRDEKPKCKNQDVWRCKQQPNKSNEKEQVIYETCGKMLNMFKSRRFIIFC